MSYRMFIERARRAATAVGLRLPMAKLNDTLSIALHDRKYAACIAAENAGKLPAMLLPPRFLQKAADLHGVQADLIRRVIDIADAASTSNDLQATIATLSPLFAVFDGRLSESLDSEDVPQWEEISTEATSVLQRFTANTLLTELTPGLVRAVSESDVFAIRPRRSLTEVASITICPKLAFYESGQWMTALPRVHDPIGIGVDAKGPSVQIGLYRATLVPPHPRDPAVLRIGFELWGPAAPRALLRLLVDHRRLLQLLLAEIPWEVHTAVWFERIENLPKNVTAFETIQTYFRHDDDDEGMITVERTFHAHDSVSEVVRTFRNALAIYDCVRGYARDTIDPDRILDHVRGISRPTNVRSPSIDWKNL